MSVLTLIIIIAFFLLIAGFSSGYETGLISIPVSMVEKKRGLSRKSDLWLIDKMQNLEKLVSITLVMTNFALSASTIVLLSAIVRFFTELQAEMITITLLVPLSIVFSEIVPKSIFRAKPSLIFRTVKIFKILYYISFPFSYLFYFFPSKLINKFSKAPARVRSLGSKEQIKVAIIKGEERGVIQEHEKTILHRVFHLGEKQVKEIMISKKRVVSVLSDLDISVVIEEFKRYEFSRLPVYNKDKEEYVGVINYMDLLIQDIDKEIDLNNFLHDIFYVDDNTYLDDLLVQMLRRNIHMVGIRNSLDEVVGMVTLEDVMEEIIGEY
ncbi:MAG: CNNM domain-containing protein [Candidatus Kaelpia aquatica]|nr:CNNM domain-containing protein [Candidatus Kaelpia aquatica]